MIGRKVEVTLIYCMGSATYLGEIVGVTRWRYQVRYETAGGVQELSVSRQTHRTDSGGAFIVIPEKAHAK